MRLVTILFAIFMIHGISAGSWDVCEHDNNNEQMIGMTAAHNVRRCRHGSPDLKWDPALAATAQSHADECKWEHSTSSERQNFYKSKGGASGWIGENIAMSSGSNYTPEQAMQGWYDDELPYYNFKTGLLTDSSKQIGHMTQIAWKKSQLLGCGVKDCPGMGLFYVCNFYPGGNIQGKYLQQVKPLKGNDASCKYTGAAKKSTFNGKYKKNQCASKNIGQGSFYQFSTCGSDTFCCPEYPCESASYSWSKKRSGCVVKGTCMNCGGGSKWWETKQSCSDGTTKETAGGSSYVAPSNSGGNTGGNSGNSGNSGSSNTGGSSNSGNSGSTQGKLDCGKRCSTSSDCCSSNMFCCPNTKLCMDRTTKGTWGASCGTCGTVSGGNSGSSTPYVKPQSNSVPCTDGNGNCPYWASSGECTKNPGYMLVNCKKSCNKCPSATPSSGNSNSNSNSGGLDCGKRCSSSSDCCSSNMFCCPNTKLCMDRTTKGTWGASCGTCGSQGSNSNSNSQAYQPGAGSTPSKGRLDCGKKCSTSSECCSSSMFCCPQWKVCMDKTTKSTYGNSCGTCNSAQNVQITSIEQSGSINMASTVLGLCAILAFVH